MNNAEFLQNTITSQWDFLKNSIMETNNLEELLDFCQKLRPYSIRNILLAIYQTNGKVQEIHGSDEWYKKFGATTKLGAIPIKIFAPDDNGGKKKFCVTNVYDISQTNFSKNYNNPPISSNMIIMFLNELCRRENISLKIGGFKSERDSALLFKTNEIFINKNSQNKIFYLLKSYFLLVISKKINSGEISVMPIALATAIAIGGSVETMCWLKERPPLIPKLAKKEILETSFENNVIFINKISKDVIKKLEILIKESQEHEKKKERTY